MTEATAYFPDDLVDEVMPADRAGPNDWIVTTPAGALALDRRWEKSETIEEGWALSDGEIAKFSRRFDYGEAMLTLRADGYSVDAPMPAEAEHCCALDGYSDALADNVDDLANQLREIGDIAIDYRIAYYRFESGLPYRFDAATRRFDPVNA